MGTWPTAWRAYQSAVKAGQLPANAAVNRFGARYRMARQLRTVRFVELSPALQDGYTAGLRLALAYSALEALEHALDKTIGDTRIDSSELADKIRDPRSARLHDALLSESTARGLRNKIETLLRTPDATDVRPVAARIRHLVFHGEFTPHGAGLSRAPGTLRLLNDLGDAVFRTADTRFTAWMQSIPPGK